MLVWGKTTMKKVTLVLCYCLVLVAAVCCRCPLACVFNRLTLSAPIHPTPRRLRQTRPSLSMVNVFSNSNAVSALLWSSFGGFLVAFVLSTAQRILTVQEVLGAWMVGMQEIVGTGRPVCQQSGGSVTGVVAEPLPAVPLRWESRSSQRMVSPSLPPPLFLAFHYAPPPSRADHDSDPGVEPWRGDHRHPHRRVHRERDW